MKAMVALVTLALMAGGPAAGGAVASDPTEVRFLSPDTPAPAATLADVAWFVGLWRGEVFGSTVEHRVEAPVGGQMPGIVSIYGDDGVIMYELSSFMIVDGRLTYRNRHFGPDLVARQAPGAYVDRPLVATAAGRLFFDGITFAADGEDAALVTFVLVDEATGVRETHTVHYARLE